MVARLRAIKTKVVQVANNKREELKIHRSSATRLIWKLIRLTTIQMKELLLLKTMDKLKQMTKIITCKTVRELRMMKGTQVVRILKT